MRAGVDGAGDVDGTEEVEALAQDQAHRSPSKLRADDVITDAVVRCMHGWGSVEGGGGSGASLSTGISSTRTEVDHGRLQYGVLCHLVVQARVLPGGQREFTG